MSDKFHHQEFRNWGDYWDMAFRRRWWILGSLFLVWACVWGMSWFLPSTYKSEVLILVQQQEIPDQYVVPNVTVSIQDRLQTITQQTLSRTRLQATIDRFHLYSSHGFLARLLNSGDPVERMRNDIEIELVKAPENPAESTAFKMRYAADSRELAQQVNSELTSLFVSEDVEAHQKQSEDTTSFLENQLAEARGKMEEQEARVAEFKTKHLGELPSQLESNVQILSGLQSQLENAHQALNMATQQKLYVESLLHQYQSAQPGSIEKDTPLTPAMTFEKALLEMRLRLQDLRSRYTDQYPDIVALEDKIAKTEKLREQLNAETPAQPADAKSASGSNPAATGSAPLAGSVSVMQLQSQLNANQLEIQNVQKHETELEAQISEYRARLNLTPQTEQGLTDISRGYEESKSNYNSLLQKQMQSRLATSLEERHKGEQFRIVDPPSLPNKPSAPNHFRVSLAGLAMGLILGLALTAYLELTDVRVRQERDVDGLVLAPVLVAIPILSSEGEDRHRLIAGFLEAGAVTVMATLIAIGNLYSFTKR